MGRFGIGQPMRRVEDQRRAVVSTAGDHVAVERIAEFDEEHLERIRSSESEVEDETAGPPQAHPKFVI